MFKNVLEKLIQVYKRMQISGDKRPSYDIGFKICPPDDRSFYTDHFEHVLLLV